MFIRLRGCTGYSAHMLKVYNNSTMAFHDVARLFIIESSSPVPTMHRKAVSASDEIGGQIDATDSSERGTDNTGFATDSENKDNNTEFERDRETHIRVRDRILKQDTIGPPASRWRADSCPRLRVS